MSTLTKQEIGKQIHLETGLPQALTLKIIDQTFNALTQYIIENEKANITNFGSFRVKNKNPRKGRNLNTGEEVMISFRKIVSFTPAENLKKTINDET